jgi:hypothetical protein
MASGKCERIRGMAKTYVKALSMYSLRGTEENKEKPKANLYPGRNSSGISLE